MSTMKVLLCIVILRSNSKVCKLLNMPLLWRVSYNWNMVILELYMTYA